MRTLHEEQRARPMHDPLGLTQHARKPADSAPAADMHSDDREISSVNPLWMITAGLAAFVVLLVAVW
jgi:hypothetical protein